MKQKQIALTFQDALTIQTAWLSGRTAGLDTKTRWHLARHFNTGEDTHVYPVSHELLAAAKVAGVTIA